MFILIGVIGASILIYGVHTSLVRSYYVTGSFLLLMTALHFKLIFFIALELIMFSGHGASLLGIGHHLQVAIPILLCVQLIIYYFLSQQLTNYTLIIGIIGIGILSIGFSFQRECLTFLGSACITLYAIDLSINESKINLLWAVLNLILAILSLHQILT
jgi:hypothetical protein